MFSIRFVRVSCVAAACAATLFVAPRTFAQTQPAPGADPAASPFAPADPIQPNGDWERFPFAPHVPIGLGPMLPFGKIDGRPASALGDNSGTVTSFELGAGVRVRRVLVDLMFAIGGAGVRGPIRDAISAVGYEPGGVLRIFAGLDGAYYLTRPESWAPWIGGRFGYEALTFNGSIGDDQHLSYSFGGMYLGLRGGADWRTAPAFGMGAYLELGGGRALSGSTSQSIDDDPITLENEAMTVEDDLDLEGGAFHGFLGLGLRVVFFP